MWGNHSPTIFSDLRNCKVDGKNALDLIDKEWYEEEFQAKVGQRGAEIIKYRGLSSAASAANAALDCMRDWIFGTTEYSSMSLYSDGTHYGVPEGIVFSFPVIVENGEPKIVDRIEFDAFSKQKMAETIYELVKEREIIQSLI